MLKPVSLPDSHESDGVMPRNVVSIDPFPAKDMAFLYGAVYSQIQSVLSEISHSPELTGKLQVMIAEDWARRIPHWPYTLLPIFSCAAAGGEMLRAGTVAAAWNLLHLAARIMDDLADDGAVIGFTPTLTMGEAAHISFTLVSLAHKLLDYLPQAGISLTVTYQIHSDLNQALMWACVGQYQDITHMTHPEFDLNSYWRMIENRPSLCLGL